MITYNTVDYQKLKEYFRKLVSASTKIDVFIGYNSKELQEAKGRFTKDTIVLVLFGYEGTLNGNQQRTLSGRMVQFGIVRRVPNNNDYENESQIIAQCENIGFHLLSRIHYDSKKPESEWLYDNFKKNTVEFNEIHNLTSIGLAGMEFSFVLATPQPLGLEVDHWNDIDQL